MKYFPLPRRLAVGILACAAASGSGALTLGRVQGLALVGRPLEITVPVLFESNGETVPECADAQVFYGDTRLPQGRITTQIDSSGAGATVRVRASAAINEPVVTVYLNVGCKDRSTRRIVLLSEQPDPRSEAAVRPVPLAQAVTEERPGAAPAPAVRSPRRARTAAPGADTTSGSAETGPATAEPPPGRSPRVAGPARSPGPVAATQPRLKLEPLDLSAPPGEPTLRMSGMMAPPPANAAEQRALAGAMWRSLNARPEDLMREVQRLEALEKDLGSLRLSIQRNDQALSEVRAQLQKAESERYANPLVYALALLALLALVAAAWAVRRSGRNVAAGSSPWWRPVQDSVDSEAPMERAGPPSVARAPQPVASRDPEDSGAPVVERRPPKQEAAPPPRPAQEFSPSMRGDDFRASNTAGVRALRAEELHDVQQEADFFISLGEFDRAIEVLRSHISMNPETSAVAWLDLMEIYHKLDRRHDYEWVRRQFQHNYNAEVPEFDNYTDASAGLEQYENAITRIVALWPSRRVLDVIEESIFRGPGSDGSNAFTLQAYRDLLLLHHIGTEVVGTQEDGRVSSYFGDLGQPPNFDPSAFSQTSINPLSALTGDNGERHGPDSGIGLDINLDEAPAVEERLIGAAHADDRDGHLLDFDLPDIDMSALKPKKTRE